MTLPEALLRNKYPEYREMIRRYVTAYGFKHIEIEARLGRIVNKITGKRINYGTEHPVVLNRIPNDCYFENGVSKADFAHVKNVICGETTLESKSDRVTISNGIRKIETDGGTVFERKVRLANYEIHIPEYRYDIRVSISKEEKAGQKDFVASRNMLTRMRDRETFGAKPLVFDFTRTSRSANDPDGKIFEVELELQGGEGDLDKFLDVLFNFPILKK